MELNKGTDVEGREKREYMKRSIFRATAWHFVVQEVFRNIFASSVPDVGS
jgi:hypothetical protein